ncbi:MAG: GFA family protein [Gammaproteobacteria bacterium]|jgi:hypothetical protein
MYEGSCLCGNIHYRIEGELSDFGYCHCTSCRKASGAAHGANAGLERRNFTLSDPMGVLREYESSPGKFRAFCSNCGSPLYAYLGATRELIRVRLGTLDTPFRKHAKAHTFVGDKAPWEIIYGDLPEFEEWASRDVLVQAGSKQP